MKRSRPVQQPGYLQFRALCCDALGFIKGSTLSFSLASLAVEMLVGATRSPIFLKG